MLWLSLTLMSRLLRVSRVKPEAVEPEGQLPGVSVVVYTRDDEDHLEQLLTQLLTQKYPAPYEVIVVNDGVPTEAQEIVARLQQQFPNLYLTFVPEHSRSLSRKKMAITLGIKAANNEVILLTCGNCTIPSDQWATLMATPFTQSKKVVIGYATPVPEKGRLTLWNAWDYLWGGVTFLSAALKGHPYRGTECNLGYRRAIFYKNKGFSAHLNFNYGDDDIFISSVATKSNTAVVLNPEAMVQETLHKPRKAHSLWRLRYDFTRPYLHTAAPEMMSSAVWAWIIITGCAVAMALTGWPSLIPLFVAAFLWLVTYTLLAVAWRKAGRRLRLRTSIFIPIMMLFRPIYNLRIRTWERKNRNVNFTWNQ